MKIKQIPFIVFVLLAIFPIPFNWSVAFSVTPGWHTVVFSWLTIISIAIFLILLIIAVCYWKLYRMNVAVPVKPFICHVLLTVIFMVFINTAELFLQTQGKSIVEIQQQIRYLYVVAFILGSLFVIGHVLFFIFFFKKIIAQKQNEDLRLMTNDFLH
jgi:hypothetical protein